MQFDVLSFLRMAKKFLAQARTTPQEYGERRMAVCWLFCRVTVMNFIAPDFRTTAKGW
jgi:hypothetical protein